MARIDELKQRGAALVAQAREIQDNPKGENGKLTPEQRSKRDNLLEEAEAVRQEAQAEERLAGVESWVAPEERGRRLPEVVEDPDATEEERQAAEMVATDEYRDAFYAYARRGEAGLSREERNMLYEARTLTEGVEADGGYLAPESLVIAVEREAQDLEELAPRMDVINTTARRIGFNREDDASLAEWGWIEELEEKPESQPSFARYYINVHTAGGVIRVSDELLEDEQFGLEPYLALIAAERRTEINETAYLSGSGDAAAPRQPWGILTRINGAAGTPQRYTTDAPDAAHLLTGDDFLRVLYALPRRHRRNATFVMGSQAFLAARLIKDAQGQYIWQPGLQAGDPDRIIGKPALESPELALDNPVAPGNDVGVVGDLRRYRILRRLQLQVKRLNELYARTDEVGFRFRWREGGDVRTPDAFRSIRIGAPA
jgi:HK97 family phage major capsid protein